MAPTLPAREDAVRVLVQDRSLLLLPGEGETAFESVGLGAGRELPDVVAGTHVLLIRR